MADKNEFDVDIKAMNHYFKLQFLLSQSYVILRDLLRKYWLIAYNEHWENMDDRENCIVKRLGENFYKDVKRKEKKLIKEGNVNKFGLTTLSRLLRAITLEGGNSDEKTELKEIQCKVNEIVEIRNKLAHHPTNQFEKTEFELHWKQLSQILIFLGFSETKLKDVLMSDNIGGMAVVDSETVNHSSTIEANKLKDQGNEAFKNDDILSAIELYSEAIELPNLSNEIQAILYSNRSIAYLKLPDVSADTICKAKCDAKFAINLRPTWWKSYYRLGCVYEVQKKYEKAIKSYNKALCFDPNQTEILNKRDGCRADMGILQRKDHLDPTKMPMSRDESLKKLSKSFGRISINPDEMASMMKFYRKSDNPQLMAEADVYFAHHYLNGTENVKQSYEEAANLFSRAAAIGNAEAIYNLANLTKVGKGVKKDIPLALKLYRKAANMPPTKSIRGFVVPNVGVAESQHSIGLCYEEGVGVDRDIRQAIQWYEKSSENGCHAADNNLGCIYFSGEGVPIDRQRGIQCWKLAASHGNVLAMQSLKTHCSHILESDEAKYWEQCTIDDGSETATNTSERENNALKELENSTEVKEVTKHLAEMSVDKKCSPTEKNEFTCAIDIDDIRNKAKEGSITAQKMLRAFDHFSKGVKLLQTNGNVTKMIHEISEAYRIDGIVCRWKFSDHERFKKIINSKLKTIDLNKPDQFEMELRICYSAMRINAFEEMLEFNKISIEKFPNEVYFYCLQGSLFGFLQNYTKGLQVTEKALKIFPNHPELLYNNAVHTRLSFEMMDKRQLIIEAYEYFLKHAPPDHRKVPESYYVMALTTLDETLHKSYYNSALMAEKKQLSCFLPYDSSSKTILERRYKVVTSFLDNQSKAKVKEANSENNSSPSASKVFDPKVLKQNMKSLSSLFRIHMIIEQRQRIKDTFDKLKKGLQYSTVIPTLAQRSPTNITGLKPITLAEMDASHEHIYEGFVLKVQSIEDACVGAPSISLLLADENQNVQRCFVYNYCCQENIQKIFGFGATFSILNPYMRITADGMAAIRIDDPNSLIFHTPGEVRKCRFCFEENVKLQVCSRCFRATYCSKDCQIQDWKLLRHRLICELKGTQQ